MSSTLSSGNIKEQNVKRYHTFSCSIPAVIRDTPSWGTQSFIDLINIKVFLGVIFISTHHPTKTRIQIFKIYCGSLVASETEQLCMCMWLWYPPWRGGSTSVVENICSSFVTSFLFFFPLLSFFFKIFYLSSYSYYLAYWLSPCQSLHPDPL